jgi:hypothetical protein
MIYDIFLNQVIFPLLIGNLTLCMGEPLYEILPPTSIAICVKELCIGIPFIQKYYADALPFPNSPVKHYQTNNPLF